MELNLFEAAKNGNLETVKELVERGANLEIADTGGQTALMLASYGGYLEVVKLLVERGANIMAKDKWVFSKL